MKTKIKIPSANSELSFMYFSYDSQEGLLVQKDSTEEVPFLRIHSSCIFSESFHTDDCDCSRQLDAALDHLHAVGGIIVYLYQEGRGLGLEKKIEAIAIEKKYGLDTALAFAKLGHEPDPRSYSAATKVLIEHGITRVSVATSNPRKIRALQEAGIEVVKTIKLEIDSNERIRDYKKSKAKALGLHEED